VESCERVSASGGSVVLLVSGLRTVYLPCRSTFAHSFRQVFLARCLGIQVIYSPIG